MRVFESEVDTMAAALEIAGAQAITISAASGEPLYHDPTHPDLTGADPTWTECWLSGLFPGTPDAATLCRRIGMEDPMPAWERDVVEEVDWQEMLHASFRPLRFPPRLWVYPSWCEPPGDERDVCVEIDPGLAFGTGTHPTTALCLEWISACAPGSLPERVIDYGCGSGILAIAALRLGAGRALAVDVDRQALAVASVNARRNAVQDRMKCVDTTHALTPARLVLANILAAPLVATAPVLSTATCIGGHLLLSGFTEDQEQYVQSAYPGFAFDRRMREGWVLLAGTRGR